MSERFSSVLYGVSENIKSHLEALPYRIKGNVEEIRLRKNLPLSITVAGESVFIKADGQTCYYPESGLVTVTEEDIKEAFRLLCNNSVFAHENELKNGYIRLKNGCRAGVFGTFDQKGDMHEVTGINIRIAREIKGVANSFADSFRGEGWLISGPPGCGKTTFLRDFIRLISNGICGKCYRVAVIDSRGEIGGRGCNDLGVNTDVINTEDKAKGLEIALRTMFPQAVAFDEIGTLEELDRVKESFNAGVAVITTAHIGSKKEITQRDITRQLLLSGAVKRVVLLPPLYGGKTEVFTLQELENELV